MKNGTIIVERERLFEVSIWLLLEIQPVFYKKLREITA